MSAILGLNINHPDASAALILDGRVVAAVMEERFGQRIKHDPSFPEHAIRSVLAIGGISAAELDYIAVARDTSQNRAAKISYVLQNPISGGMAAFEHFRRARSDLGVEAQVALACGLAPDALKARLVNVEHHLSHIASAYYCSPFDGLTAGFSYDGSGDFVSAMAARCEGSRIEVLDRVRLPSSLGFFYTACCQFIGFDQFGEEYKVMGLAPYGEDRFAEAMRKLVVTHDDAWFSLADGFFGMHRGGHDAKLDGDNRMKMLRLYSDRWRDLFGEPRSRTEALSQRDMDIARSCQVRFEEIALHCFNRLQHLVPTSQIAYAGGCALNGVMNARLLRETAFDRAYMQPASSDDGLSVGAALWTWHNVAGGGERFHMQHAYWGPDHSQAAMLRAAEATGAPMRELPLVQVPQAVARLIHAGLVVGWYQGRSEWGPRALGNRSILADPTKADMKDIINAKIKRRESFRPFAPSVLRSAVTTYFEQDVFSPFMMHVVKLKPEWRPRLPAITHVDGTGRLQSIDRDTNPLYYSVIECFGQLSGVPIVLNTSFNENEPIVDTPQQAADCFMRTGLDALCLGPYLLVKGEHLHELANACMESSVALPS
ncbi:putative Carbamoyltransferase family protein [Bradyrhizobium sp. ORS 278]|uniref:carbamoyltransferase family protein n=1 Tax=Bradyrhizobium sp. (strain ORS 278) TaxID=114615 RepID=UPI0001507CB5|nr:carbamoyltransferase C-terminal domain-containing protein [Bradyrhizobium sp. ORS 278]CAL76052.1 putative Carbamoyltransferase family protein [Bradyrhizobium sp. ORS 278]